MSLSKSITAPLGRARRTGGNRNRRNAVLLALLAGTAVAGYAAYIQFWKDEAPQAAAYTTADVTRQTVSSNVSASGTVAASKQVKLSFPTAGKVSSVAVRQGDTVQEGQEVATIDATTLQIKRDTAQSQLASAQARLDELLAGATSAEIAAQQQAVASARSALTTAQNNLTNLLTGATAEDVAAARASLDSAKAALDVAQANYDKLASGQDLTLRSEYSALQTAKSNYQNALTNYTNKTSPNPADVAAAQAALTSARSGLESAEAKLTALQNPSAADVAAAQASVQSAQAQVESARAKYASLVIGGSITDRQAAQAAVDAAQAALLSAQSKYTATVSAQDATDADMVTAQAAVASAQAALLTAQNNLAKLQGQTAGAELSSAEQAQRSAEAAVATAQTNLSNLLSPSPANLAAAQQGVASARSTLETAQSNLDKLINPNPAEVAQVQTALDSAKAALDTAQTNWDRLVSGANLGTSTEAAALKSAQAAYQSAVATYTTKSAGPKAGDVAAAQASVTSASAGLNAAQAKLAELLAGSPVADVVQQQETMRQLELAVQSAENDLNAATLRAPFTGTVVAVSVNPGDQASAGTAIATLLDPNLIRVDATLDESGVARVKTGQQAVVTFDAIAGKQFRGQVASVTPSGTTTNGVVTFPVTITFDPQGTAIPAGLTASVRIVTERKENVIAVSSRAVTRQGNQSTVNVVKEDGTLESRAVQTGITGDNSTVEIVSGLSEGEKVAILMTTAQRTGTATGGTFGTGGLTPGSAPAPANRPPGGGG